MQLAEATINPGLVRESFCLSPHHPQRDGMSIRVHTSSGSRRMVRTVAVVMAHILAACDSSPTEPHLDPDPDIRALVTGAAADSLGADGRFMGNADVSASREGMPVVTAARARELAAAFARSFGPAFHDDWIKERGGPIALAALVPSARVFPLHTVHESVPDVGCHPSHIRSFGSYYLLTLDDGSDQNVRLGVSAQTTEYSVGPNGELVEPSRTGSDFDSDGVRVDGKGRILLSPEQAVALAAAATGRLVTAVPRLFGRGILWVSTAALWRVTLDQPVTAARADGRSVQTQVLFVSSEADSRFFVADDVQPSSATLTCWKVDENLVDSGTETITVQIRPDQPTAFTNVTLHR